MIRARSIRSASRARARAASTRSARAIASAIDDAIGIPGAITQLPVTPQRLKAILDGTRVIAESDPGRGDGVNGGIVARRTDLHATCHRAVTAMRRLRRGAVRRGGACVKDGLSAKASTGWSPPAIRPPMPRSWRSVTPVASRHPRARRRRHLYELRAVPDVPRRSVVVAGIARSSTPTAAPTPPRSASTTRRSTRRCAAPLGPAPAADPPAGRLGGAGRLPQVVQQAGPRTLLNVPMRPE